ncbi:NTP transferase domain-containing protein [Candidatus Kuenenbacteria bacterium]|nr:NTP transferase domain-containing protein [Candidatus Kuenenbacteria bacterium]
MRGIILSGGSGTRLRPLTNVTSKQLLPVYNKPMIYYPLNTLIKAGIREIMIIVAPEHAGDYLKLLGSGSRFGCKLTYEVQDNPNGLPEAFVIGKNFIDEENVALILGDNLFEDDFTKDVKKFKSGAKIFAKKVPDPERSGVVKFNKNKTAQLIVEKPKKWISDYAITGFYLYDHRVAKIAAALKPSTRGETEIVDLHNWYLERRELAVGIIKGIWHDAGTLESYFEAQILAKERLQKKLVI